MGGADRVTAGDGGQPLHVGAQQPFECAGLGLAQLLELGRDVRDRAVVLAELPAGADAVGRGSVALAGQRQGQRLDLAIGGADLDAVALLDAADAALGEVGDRLLPAGLGQEADGGRGQVVVRVREAAPAVGGEQELPGRPAAAPLRAAERALLAIGGQPVRDQRVQVAADRGGADAQALAQRGSGVSTRLRQAKSSNRAATLDGIHVAVGRVDDLFQRFALRKPAGGQADAERDVVPPRVRCDMDSPCGLHQAAE